MTIPTTVSLHPLVAEEDRARAEFYALLGRLYSAAPDAALLAAIGASDPWPDEDASPLAVAWNRLVRASRAMDAEAAEQEYTDLFVGVGKAECNLHASHWTPDSGQRPLVAIRSELAALGLARVHASAVYEDHLGALCEAMRLLIAGAPGRGAEPLSVQRQFFDRFLGVWVDECCGAITRCTIANYYRRVAEFTLLFMAVERDSFAID
jgi:TorA maturation chaperone TorD